ncbi:hypothetical protein AKJ09_09148 [Labilithrix luteola]|uniref:AMIN domain-containing protein n=1 Tax=Labilithrix luteola TaxID=1391654 RepID=A0A0K1QAN6_9BACT|nr:hypothetical protein AKJ09_09148 [Labilithrix luteola]
MITPAAAHAQAAPAGSATAAGSASAGGDSTPPAGGEQGESKDAGEKKPTVPAAGYAYSDKPVKSAHAARLRKAPAGPTATMPGFEALPDGGSRLFVQLTQPVQVEEHKAQGSLTYILKGAYVRQRNNLNSLVTVHFNTPVSRARLVPHGNDLHFVIDLRASGAAPTWKMQAAPDKSAKLIIDFPKGDYGLAPSAAPSPGEGEGDEGTENRPAPKNIGKKGGAKSRR